MSDWLQDWLPNEELHAPAVLVTVARVEGSVPREPGARMLVDARGFRGTIGGGHLEHRALEMARAMLEQGGGQAHIERFPLGPKLGQCCGGIAWLAFEMADADQLELLAARRNEDSWRVVFVGWAGSPPTLRPCSTGVDDCLPAGTLPHSTALQARTSSRTTPAASGWPMPCWPRAPT